MQDLISVVVPVYNVEKYLIRCVESIISQTYSPIEVILVDDGSSDSCPKICDEYACKFENIRVIHLKNGGPSIARNIGIQNVIGNFMTFVDSDDFLHPKLIEVLKKNMDDCNVSVSMCAFYKYKEDDKVHYTSTSDANLKIVSDQDAMNMLLDKQDLCAPWGKLYNIRHFKTIRFPVNKIYEDMLTIPLIFREAKLISLNSLKLYYYNQEGFSITRSIFDEKKILNLIEASRFWEIFTSAHYPEIANKAKLHHLTNIINVCVQIAKQDNQMNSQLFIQNKAEILRNFYFLFFSTGFRWQDKVKLICLRLGLFKILLLLKY